MEFGNRKSFAIECLIDYAMTLVEDCMSSVQGRIRVWMNDEAIGTLDEWGVVLGPVAEQLQALVRGESGNPRTLTKRWHPVLESLSPIERHCLLRLIGFGESVQNPEFTKALSIHAEDPAVQSKCRGTAILTNIAESFDGWGVFVAVDPTTKVALFSWDRTAFKKIRFANVPMTEVEKVTGAFVAWLAGEQQAWNEPD